MAMVTTISFLLLTLLWVTIPILRSLRKSGEESLEEAVFLVKLRLVRKYYPELHELSYTEIAERFDIDRAYENIGRSIYEQRRWERENFQIH